MAIISKDGYDRKREYAARKMEENRLVDTLTAEQHDVLAWLCAYRHTMHVDQESLFHSESSNFSTMWSDYDSINNRLCECGLSPITLPDSIDIPSDADGEFDEDFVYEEALESFFEIIEGINNTIESYLRDIDRTHHTNYCPTGASRIF